MMHELAALLYKQAVANVYKFAWDHNELITK